MLDAGIGQVCALMEIVHAATGMNVSMLFYGGENGHSQSFLRATLGRVMKQRAQRIVPDEVIGIQLCQAFVS